MDLQRRSTNDGSFHRAISKVLLLGNCVGLPILGATARDSSRAHFRLKSFRAIYSLYLLVMSLIFLLCYVIWLIQAGDASLTKFTILINRLRNVLCLLCFQSLARNWNRLIRKWTSVEQYLPMLTTPEERNFVSRRINMLQLIVITVSLIENSISAVLTLMSVNRCQTQNKVKAFLIISHPEIFYTLHNSVVIGVIARLTSYLLSLMGSYRDLFVMCISVALTARFQQVNKILLLHKGKSMLPSFYHEHRLYHRKLVSLVGDADRAISSITMLALSNNLFYICTSLLNSLYPKGDFLQTFYFWFSLSMLIMRTSLMCILASNVNEEAKKPVEVLRKVPSDCWSNETKRFQRELYNDICALTGMNFFPITRRIVLSICSTIITYEIFLIQFQDSNKAGSASDDPCHGML